MASLKILLGPPDYVIADQLNKESKELTKKISVKNIRVAYQTLMLFHENGELFPFLPRPKETLDRTTTTTPKVSTMSMLQISQSKVLPHN